MTSKTVSEYMTHSPATISTDLLLSDALDRMFSTNVRHLPVVNDEDVLVGVITTRDVALAASVRGLNPERAVVASAMTERPFSCEGSTPLEEVIEHMERDRYGSVVVTEAGKPVGVFTTTDALRALRGMLHGGPVEPLVEPQHEREASDGSARSHHSRRRSGGGVSKYDGMVSWFLTRL